MTRKYIIEQRTTVIQVFLSHILSYFANSKSIILCNRKQKKNIQKQQQ